eukprot:277531-Lingulodinium_polyedra.AAC.1
MHAEAPEWAILGVMLEYCGLTARACVPGAGESAPFPLTRGGPMGRTEVPEIFNLVMEYGLAKCAK